MLLRCAVGAADQKLSSRTAFEQSRYVVALLVIKHSINAMLRRLCMCTCVHVLHIPHEHAQTLGCAYLTNLQTELSILKTSRNRKYTGALKVPDYVLADHAA